MTTPDPNVGTPAAGGAEAQPASPVSPTSESPIGGDAIKLLTELGGKFSSLERELRGLQSRQDKTENNFQAQLAKFNQIKTQGNLSDEQALAAMSREDAEAARWANLESKISELAGRLGGIGSTPTEQQLVAEVMSEFKLDPRDPFVAADLQGKQFKNRTEAEAWAGRMLLIKSTSNQPNPAQSASAPGGSVATASPDEQFVRLQELYKNYTVNQAEIKNIEASLKAAGHMR